MLSLSYLWAPFFSHFLLACAVQAMLRCTACAESVTVDVVTSDVFSSLHSSVCIHMLQLLLLLPLVGTKAEWADSVL